MATGYGDPRVTVQTASCHDCDWKWFGVGSMEQASLHSDEYQHDTLVITYTVNEGKKGAVQ